MANENLSWLQENRGLKSASARAQNGVSATGSGDVIGDGWTMGLMNSGGKYLTAETFGFKLNASSTNMRQKQLWVIENDTTENIYYLRSHLGRYLSTDKYGQVTCEAESRGSAEQFNIQYHPDGSGRWAIRSVPHNTYFGGSEDELLCKKTAPTETEWWTMRLAIHPQLNLFSVSRKKFARLATGDDGNEHIHCDEITPWGQDALITLEFTKGKYTIRTCNGKYLTKGGSLVNSPSDDTMFSLEICSGQWTGLAFRSPDGKYLTASMGVHAVLQTKNKNINKDELFTLQDSHPQVFFTAHNGKMVSTKQGVDLSANQEELSDCETFQVEYDKASTKWKIRTNINKYWSLESASGIQNVGNGTRDSCLFDIEYLDAGSVAIKANNNMYVTAKMNGSLYAVSSNPEEPKARFFFTVMNRPILVLKCEHGFIGMRSPSNPRVECNKATPDVIHMEHSSDPLGYYFLKGANGKYWMVDEAGNISAETSEPTPFMFRFSGQSKMYILTADGRYVTGEQNGIVSAKAKGPKTTLWEY